MYTYFLLYFFLFPLLISAFFNKKKPSKFRDILFAVIWVVGSALFWLYR